MHSHIKGMTLAAAAALLTFSCAAGQRAALQPSARAAAAQGEVRSERGDGGNTELTIEVEHLAPAPTIAPGTTTYVVWAKPTTGKKDPDNLGALEVSGDRKGKLKTITPLSDFEVIVTPESSATVRRPSNEPVLRAKVLP